MSGNSINLNFLSKLLEECARDSTRGRSVWWGVSDRWPSSFRLSDSGDDAFVFALSQFREPDYLWAWNRLGERRCPNVPFSLAFQVFPKCQHIVLKGLQGGGGGGGGLVLQYTQGGSTIKRIFHWITSEVWTWQWLCNQLVEASTTGEFNLLDESLLIEWHLHWERTWLNIRKWTEVALNTSAQYLGSYWKFLIGLEVSGNAMTFDEVQNSAHPGLLGKYQLKDESKAILNKSVTWMT